jgi:hypothetical protein
MEQVTVYCILGAKGGMGKSLISKFVANLLVKMDEKVKFFDNDSETAKFRQIKRFNAEHIQLFELDQDGKPKAESLNIDKMNTIVEAIESGEYSRILIDNGSPSFQAFQSFFTIEALEMLNEVGVKLVFICPTTQDSITHTAPKELVATYGDLVQYIVVENEHFGSFDFDLSEFEKANVEVAKLKLEAFTTSQLETIKKVEVNHLSLDEAIGSKMFTLVEKSRLVKIRNGFEGILEQIITDFEE